LKPSLKPIRRDVMRRLFVLGICGGGIAAADTGLLDGHIATTNVGVMSNLAAKHRATTMSAQSALLRR
jgi:transcriptional regulator GlxA family with amidase domain